MNFPEFPGSAFFLALLDSVKGSPEFSEFSGISLVRKLPYFEPEWLKSDFSRKKNQPKEEVFGADALRTSRGHSRGYPSSVKILEKQAFWRGHPWPEETSSLGWFFFFEKSLLSHLGGLDVTSWSLLSLFYKKRKWSLFSLFWVRLMISSFGSEQAW